jgi:hypothetical protein
LGPSGQRCETTKLRACETALLSDWTNPALACNGTGWWRILSPTRSARGRCADSASRLARSAPTMHARSRARGCESQPAASPEPRNAHPGGSQNGWHRMPSAAQGNARKTQWPERRAAVPERETKLLTRPVRDR